MRPDRPLKRSPEIQALNTLPGSATSPNPARPLPGKGIAVLIVALGFSFGVTAYLLAAAWSWGRASSYIALFASQYLVLVPCIIRWNPGLIKRRMKLGPGTKGWDKAFLWITTLRDPFRKP